MTQFESERLVIRTWKDGDAPALYRMCLDAEIQASGIDTYADVEQSLERIGKWRVRDEMWAVVRKADSRVIGLIGLCDMNRYPEYKELEYAIAADCRRQGYASEALSRTLDHAFSDLGLSVVAAWLRRHNEASARVLARCGFSHEGTLRRHGRDRGDTLCYSILKEEWAAAPHFASFR